MADMKAPNHRVESNRCQASRLRSWRVIGNGFCVCDGAPSAAVAHPCRSAAGRHFTHNLNLKGTALGEYNSNQNPQIFGRRHHCLRNSSSFRQSEC